MKLIDHQMLAYLESGLSWRDLCWRPEYGIMIEDDRQAILRKLELKALQQNTKAS